ncbi:MAG: PEP-CTERM sorting domain-containing protein, partial [Burkholderiales bacterium]|nr:PEP-CTERM sorting domain-containing protein [Burkholderiales bacterium]
GATYVGAVSNGMANNFGGSAPFYDTAAIGQSQNFFFMTPLYNVRGGLAGTITTQMGNAAGVSSFTLGSNGVLSYQVAAVPEPGEWALMLSGFGLFGFIAKRRKEMKA